MATSSTSPAVEDEEQHFLFNPFKKAIIVDSTISNYSPLRLFLKPPWYAPLLIPNETSDARDHAANERTFLSWLRLSIYLAVVSVAIFVNFHLKHEPTDLEIRLSHPLGIIFWVLAIACLISGTANYIRTVSKYAKKAALVQSGMKTQIVFGVVASAIIAACGVFLGAKAQADRERVGSLTQQNADLRNQQIDHIWTVLNYFGSVVQS